LASVDEESPIHPYHSIDNPFNVPRGCLKAAQMNLKPIFRDKTAILIHHIMPAEPVRSWRCRSCKPRER
jgi:hypothetical protein